MKRNKRVFMVPGVYISFVKDYLPLYEAHQWMGIDKNALLPSWNIPTEVKYHYKEPKEKEEKKKEEPEKKEGGKEKLSFTSQELKRAKQEDKESLKDVEKLEEHLEEDIDEAEKKLKQK